MATLEENSTRIANALEDIKSSIIAKGQTPTGKCETFSVAIDNITVGTNVSDTTATAEDVLSGKEFYAADGTKTQGNILDKKNKYVTMTVHPNSSASEALWFSVDDKMCVDENTSLTINDSLGMASSSDVRLGKTFSSDNGFSIEGTLEVMDTSDTTATQLSVEYGRLFHDKDGNIAYGSCPNKTTSGIDVSASSVSGNEVSSNVHLEQTGIFPAPYFVGENTEIRTDISSLLQTKNVTLTSSQQTITADEGKILSSVVVPASSGGGTDVSDTTATASDVVSGKIFHTANGTKTTGTALSAKTGTFSGSTSGYVTVTLGFQPKYITISSSTEYGISVASTETFTYMSTGSSTTKVRWFRNTSNQLQQDTSTYMEDCITITTTGFKYKCRVSNDKTMRYFAVS